MRDDDTIDAFNKLLRGEIAAVETYRIALERVKDAERKRVLRENLGSHERRVGLLRTEILRQGGEPSAGSGLWGAFARIYQGGAGWFGEDAAIDALENGEEQGSRDQDAIAEILDLVARQFLDAALAPEQERTRRAIAGLLKVQA